MHQNSTPQLQLKSCSLLLHLAPTTRLEMAGFVGQMESGPKKQISFPTLSLPHPGPEAERLHQPWAVSRGAAPRVRAPPSRFSTCAEQSIAATSSPCLYIVLTSLGLLMGGGRVPIRHLKSHLKLEKKMSGRERETVTQIGI